MLTIDTEAFESREQFATALRLALAGRPGPFQQRLEELCRELMRSPLQLVPVGRCRFQTAGGVWQPQSVLPAAQLFVLATFPNKRLLIEEGADKLPATRAALKRARDSLALHDPRFAEVFRMARERNGLGLHLGTDAGHVVGELRVRGHRPIQTVT